MTAETSAGPWEPLPAVLSQDEKSVIVTIDHLSLFEPLLLDLEGLVKAFKEGFLDALIPEAFSSTKPPTCQNESQARQDGYSITSTTKRNTIYWCFGKEKDKRVLKVMNNRSYALTASHSGLTVTSPSEVPLELKKLEELDANLRQEVLILPGKEVSFAAELAAGKRAKVQTQWDPEAQVLDALQVVVVAAVDIVKFFGFKAPRTLVIVGKLLSSAACFGETQTEVTTSKQNPGKFFATCLTAENVKKAFGEIWGDFYAFILTLKGVVDFLVGSAFGLVGSFLMDDQYEVAISRSLPLPCPPSAGTCLGIRSGDMDGDGRSDQVGVTFKPGSDQFVVYVVLATGQAFAKVVSPTYQQAVNNHDVYTSASFLGLSDIDGNGKDEVVIRPICDDSCGYVALELLQGSLQSVPFYGLSGDGITADEVGAIVCSVVNGIHQVSVYYQYATPGGIGVYQPDGKGGMKLVSFKQGGAIPGPVGTHCPGLATK